MLFNMDAKLFYGVVAIMAMQVYLASSMDPKLEQCKKKFSDQINQIDISHLPSCFDANKLAQTKTHTEIFGKLFDSLPQKCKKPTSSDAKYCVSEVLSYFKDHTEEFQANIAGALSALYQALKGCIDEGVKQFSNLDTYIANGCTDE